MISRSNIAGRTFRNLQTFFRRRRFAIDTPLAPRAPCRELWVVQSDGHVFAKLTPREREDWSLPAEIHFGAGAEYQDNDGRVRRRGRLRKQEEPWMETRRVNVGEIDTPEKATLMHCMIGIVEQSDYDPTNVDAFSCIGATDAFVATLRQQPPLAPVGANTLDGARDYMAKLTDSSDPSPAAELTFHIR
jgi:hypothetical protein